MGAYQINYNYNNYSLNINQRSLSIDEVKTRNLIIELASKSDAFSVSYSELLKNQFNDYLENKTKSKRELQGRRRVEFAGLRSEERRVGKEC